MPKKRPRTSFGDHLFDFEAPATQKDILETSTQEICWQDSDNEDDYQFKNSPILNQTSSKDIFLKSTPSQDPIDSNEILQSPILNSSILPKSNNKQKLFDPSAKKRARHSLTADVRKEDLQQPKWVNKGLKLIETIHNQELPSPSDRIESIDSNESFNSSNKSKSVAKSLFQEESSSDSRNSTTVSRTENDFNDLKLSHDSENDDNILSLHSSYESVSVVEKKQKIEFEKNKRLCSAKKITKSGLAGRFQALLQSRDSEAVLKSHFKRSQNKQLGEMRLVVLEINDKLFWNQWSCKITDESYPNADYVELILKDKDLMAPLGSEILIRKPYEILSHNDSEIIVIGGIKRYKILDMPFKANVEQMKSSTNEIVFKYKP